MAATQQREIESDIPNRMDRLPWSKFHWLVIIALGITWILDGLEITLAGTIGPTLTSKATLGLTESEVGLTATAYLAGAVLGSLVFGYMTDRWGRKKLFMVTLLIYLVFTGATAFSWDMWSFFAFRFLTGFGIGGEYAAINSAIDELIPARNRGWTDLAINGTWWFGTILGSLVTIPLLNPKFLSVDTGWRFAFGIGVVIGVGILLVRRFVPESPRWALIHERQDDAENIVRDIEERVKRDEGVQELPEPEGEPIRITPREHTPFGEIMSTMFNKFRKRSVLGLSLMISQAFFYNAVFFTFGLVLTTFYKVSDSAVPWYILAFAVGNFLGPLTIGRLFDVVGRRPMITITYALSGGLLILFGWWFSQGTISDIQFTAGLSVIFFIASAAASSAYLTVSEVFPIETRAMAIAVFYSIGTGVGGMLSPWLFGSLIGSQNKTNVFYGYLFGAVLMLIAAAMELWLGVAAEQQQLEQVAKPLSATGDSDEDTSRAKTGGETDSAREDTDTRRTA
jgi:MFS family permease